MRASPAPRKDETIRLRCEGHRECFSLGQMTAKIGRVRSSLMSAETPRGDSESGVFFVSQIVRSLRVVETLVCLEGIYRRKSTDWSMKECAPVRYCAPLEGVGGSLHHADPPVMLDSERAVDVP